MKITKLTLATLVAAGAFLTSCSDDDTTLEPTNPTLPSSYEFTRDGKTTVSFSGQTACLKMVNEVGAGLKDDAKNATSLISALTTGKGFADSDLNNSGKNVRGKISSSLGLFGSDKNESGQGKTNVELFDTYVKKQFSEVLANKDVDAKKGVAGKIDDGGTTRLVNANGLEYDQAYFKGLIGGLVVDQVVNHYLNRLDEDKFDGSNSFRKANDAGTLATDKNYTTMEHHFDEAYGYVYGIGEQGSDKLLWKYIGRVNGQANFTTIAEDIEKAFIKARFAITQKDYTERDKQIAIIRKKIAYVVAVRSVYYLQAGKAIIEDSNKSREEAFHDLSEGYGFVHSLRYLTLDGKTPIFTQAEADGFIEKLDKGTPKVLLPIEGKANAKELKLGYGFWTITPDTLDEISNAIAAKFTFTTAEAAE